MAKKILFVISMLFSIAIYAQNGTGSISGTVTDPKSGETIPGVTVIVNDRNTVTDINGSFVLSGLSEGEQLVVFKTLGYKESSVRISVKPGKDTKITVRMDEASSALNEVVIEGETRKGSISSMMLLQKNSITVSDGISGDAIKKSPDKNTGEVLKRISGTTIQNNKFVVIRGLNERYNAAFVDGMPMPSSESDRKAFAFDIFPSGLLESIMVTKSASPDLPSDFSGGVIRISTKGIPDSSITNVSFSQGLVTGTTFNPYYTYKGGKYDLLGIDDGTRALPSDLANTEKARGFNNIQKSEQAKFMKNDWALQQKSLAAPTTTFQLTHGDSWKKEKLRAGYITGISYNYSNRITNSIRREFDSGIEENEPLQQFELKDVDYMQNVLGGVFANATVIIADRHTINVRNIFTENSEDKVVTRSGVRDFDQDIQTEERSSIRSFTQNQFYMNQFAGESVFRKAGLTLTWNGGRAVVKRDIPSIKRMVYTRSIDKNNLDVAGAFEASIPTSGTSPSSGGNIFTSRTYELIRNVSADLSKKFSFQRAELSIKAGGYYQARDRQFDSRQFGYSRYSQGSKVIFDKSLLVLPEDKIFAEENLGIIQPYMPASPGKPAVKGVGGFKLEEATKLNDSYTAGSLLHAAYLMQDLRIMNMIKLNGGVRMENYRQFLMSYEDDGDTVNIDTTYHDLLPSANLVYSPNESMNFRLSYGQTVSRPEFRELAPFGFFDFTSFYSVRGNPELRRALIHNYDFRFEYFTKRNQMISASLFCKQYFNPIEQINRVDVPREVFYTNVDKGLNYGAEVEFRVGLCSILSDENVSPWSKLYFTSNIAYIISKVRVDSIQGSLSPVRSLQGQSPYVLNAGVSYEDNEHGLIASALLNRVGRRLFIVGNTQEPDTYEHSRTVIDIMLEKKLGNNVSLKASAKDILAQETIFYQDINLNGKLDKNGPDNILSQSKYGSTYSITISLIF